MPHGTPPPLAGTELKALAFLQREVPAWHRQNGCYSCHNNGDAARALFRASALGHPMPDAVLRDTIDWLSQPEGWEHNRGDPGFSDQRLANLQFGLSTLAATQSRAWPLPSAALQAAAGKIALDQAADGSWPIELQNSAGSPATYGTALATALGLRVLRAAEAPALSGPIGRAENWLRNIPINNLPRAAAVVFGAVRDDERRGIALNLIQRSQNPDGGWGPYRDSPSEAFDTALALLAFASLREGRELDAFITRGRRFLAACQNHDGSWPATTRPTGGESYAQQLSTTGWAVLALLETVPE